MLFAVFIKNMIQNDSSSSVVLGIELEMGFKTVGVLSPVFTAQTNPGSTRVKTNPGCVYTTLF